MSLVDAKTGEIIYNANEQAAMRNETGVLKAQPLTPEEEAQEKQTQDKIKQEKRMAITLEKKKESAWTETKLRILALQGAHKRTSSARNPEEFDLPAGSINENLAIIEPVLFERFGEPREFIEDMNMILAGFENEKIVIEGNEMQKINEYGKKYLLGLLIQKHIFEQGFSISVDSGNQPVLRDERANSDIKRQEQMQGLQDALRQFEFSQNVRNILKKNDNSSLVAEYIAANTHEKHPNLVDHRNALARKMGITSPNISPEQAQTILTSTSLTPEEKSFLLAWKDTRQDKTLIEIGKQQTDFVKYAQENIDKKTPETHLRELVEKPFTKSAQLLAGGAIGGALLYLAYKQMKKGGVWGTISGLIAGLIGGSIMLPLGDKAWQTLGLSDALKNIQEGKPVDREASQDHPFARIDVNIIGPTKDLWERMYARLASGKEGIDILMQPQVGPDIAKKYPVYSMLSSLNPDERMIGGDYEAPDTALPQTEIQSALGKLKKSPDQQAQLNTLLTDTWERYQDTDEYKKKNETERKQVTLDTMLAAIELEDGWLNNLIDPISSKPEKDAAMRVIGQNPKEWGKVSLEDIRLYFLNIPNDPGRNWRKTHPSISPLISTVPNSISILTNYFKTVEEKMTRADENMTLQNFLLS